ncbi:MAG: class I SAM-dependent methyltransferase [Bryobacteraceae bacterium]
MVEPDVADRMRDDWNARAREDAGYYVAFGRRDQSPEEFFSTADEVVKGLRWELRRLSAGDRKALEIGCGPGRLLRPMSEVFVEIHGVDVSNEMVDRARANLAERPNAFAHHTDGATLRAFADDSFDFVYSYAVFQHIPSSEVVFEYLQHAHRVLKPGGILRAQFNGLPAGQSSYDTWSGVRLSASDLLSFAGEHDFQVLALEGVSTQYMWSTWRKHPRGWFERMFDRQDQELELDPQPAIRRITNAESTEPVAPSRGRYASISLWIANLPAECGLHHLRVTIGSAFGTVTYIGPPDASRLQQVNVLLPPLEATGLLPVEVAWLGKLLCPPATLRVIPPGPQVPRILSVTDGVNLMSGTTIQTRAVKIVVEELMHPDEFGAEVGGHPVEDLEIFCTDPRPQRFEVNFHLPEETGSGRQDLILRIGRRKFGPIPLEVA